MRGLHLGMNFSVPLPFYISDKLVCHLSVEKILKFVSFYRYMQVKLDE